MFGTAVFFTSVTASVLRTFAFSTKFQRDENAKCTNCNPNPQPWQPRRGKVEVCLSDIESVRNAIQGGATSIELCVDRSGGGISPSMGLVEQAVHLCAGKNVAVNVLVRPRVGNFLYTAEEFDVIVRDVIGYRNCGADGVVVGFLDDKNDVDVAKLAVIRKLASNMILTFHRAFDVCHDPEKALNAIISAGCDRLLTSGCSSSAANEKVM